LTANGTDRFDALPADTRETAVFENAERAVEVKVLRQGFKMRDEPPEK